MTQNVPVMRPAPPLSLRQAAPADWHRDPPAYAGDPDMDWENRPEPPREPRWSLVERGPKQPAKQH